MKSVKLIEKALHEPFSPSDIQWRIQSSGISKEGKPWGKILAYVDNRAIIKRLDEIFGFDGWENEYIHLPGMVTQNPDTRNQQVMKQFITNAGFICRLRVRMGENWITKEEVAGCTNIEAIKGGASDSMKRVGKMFGIGRYLYEIGETWAQFYQDLPEQNKANFPYNSAIKSKDQNFNWTQKYYNWAPPQLEDKYLPREPDDKKIEQWLELAECRDDLTFIYVRMSQQQRQSWETHFKNRLEQLG
jgi:hypothetical protein